MRFFDAGYFSNICIGRIGRLTKLPAQLGHLKCNVVSAQSAQKVHSNVQMNADPESGGKSLSQHSQLGRISNM